MIVLFVFIVICFASAAVGSICTNQSLKTWYPTIKKPSWNPPNKIFAPVWTSLYIMMAVAGWMVWERSAQHSFSLPMILFVVQLTLNTLWSAIFFGLRNPALAFGEVILLWISIFLTMVSFWQIYWIAGLLFLPYFLWVSFAMILNFTIWQLNK